MLHKLCDIHIMGFCAPIRKNESEICIDIKQSLKIYSVIQWESKVQNSVDTMRLLV